MKLTTSKLKRIIKEQLGGSNVPEEIMREYADELGFDVIEDERGLSITDGEKKATLTNGKYEERKVIIFQESDGTEQAVRVREGELEFELEGHFEDPMRDYL